MYKRAYVCLCCFSSALNALNAYRCSSCSMFPNHSSSLRIQVAKSIQQLWCWDLRPWVRRCSPFAAFVVAKFYGCHVYFFFLPWLLKGFAHISPIPLLIRFFWAAPAIIDICQSHVLSSLAMTSLIHPDTDSHTVVSKSSRVLSHTASRQKLHLHMWTLFLWIFTLPNRWLWAFWRRTGQFQECTECPTYRGRPEGSGPMRKLREMQQV